VTVAGVIGEGTSREMTANWTSPFADKSLGSMFASLGGLSQTFTDRTSITTLNSRLIWEGNESHTLNLVLRLYALRDPKKEVMDAIEALEKMASPQLNDSPIDYSEGIGGRVPSRVSINIGRCFIWNECVILGVQTPLDKEKNKEGYMIRADVNLQIKTLSMINQSQISSTFG
jgi:hypothetical protein